MFSEGSTARGKLKSISKAMVGVYYSKTLVAESFLGGNQLEEQSIVQRQVEDILQDGIYLQGPQDANV